jgi:hypothetical protein
MAIREGRWDCPSCGSKAVYGRHVDCPGCGKPRPAGIRFYLTDDAPVITDAAQLAEATAGADWVCEHCGASTRASLSNCSGCGAARGTSPSQPVIDYAMGQVPRSGDDPPRVEPPVVLPALAASSGVWRERPEPAPEESDLPPIPEERNVAGLGLGLAALALIALFALVGLNSASTEPRRAAEYAMLVADVELLPATVAGMRWEREVSIETRTMEEGATFQLPDSAQVLGRERVVQSYERVQDGYRMESREVPDEQQVTDYRTRTREVRERVQTGTRTYVCGQRDLGNGYFEDRECTEPVYETRFRTESYQEPYTRTQRGTRTVRENVPVYRSVPVYGTRYRWRAPVWHATTVAVARGDTAAPAWPEPALGANQRLGSRYGRYFITLRQPGKPDREIEIQEHEWDRYRVGQPLALRFDRYTDRPMILPADSLRACRLWRAGTTGPPPDSLGCAPLQVPAADSSRADSTADSLAATSAPN